MSEKIEFDLKVKNNELDKALEDGAKKAVNLEGVLQTALGVLGGNIATKGLELIGDAFANVRDFALESIDAYAEQEDALNKLGQALRATGSFSEQAVEGISAFASELQKTSKFGDEVIIGQVAFVKSLGATTEQSKALVQAAANLSSVLGGSLEENTEKLGKTLSGTAGRLAQYIPELKNLTQEQLRAGAAADIINQKFGGAAANDLKTYSGSVIAAKNAFSDLQEEIGGILVNNSLVKGSVDIAKNAFEALTKGIVELREKAQGTDPLNKVSKSSEEAAVQVVRLNEQIAKLNKELENSNLLTPGYSAVISAELDKVIKKRDEVEEKLQFGKIKSPVIVPEVSNVARPDEEIKKEQQKVQEIANIRKQALLEQRNFEQQFENEQLEDQSVKQAEEINRIREFEIQKAELKAELDIAKAESQLTGADRNLEIERINAEKRIAIEKSKNDSLIKLQQLANKNAEQAVKEEDKFNKIRESNQRDSFATIATLANSNNKTLAAIGKAAALTQIAIDGPAAITKALAAFPPPFNFAAATAVGAAVAAQAARVAGVAFADGGFINGAGGATMGPDTTTAQVRDGEMVLNAGQQKQLFEAINSGSLGGRGDIVIQINSREIARAVRDEVASGFVLA